MRRLQQSISGEHSRYALPSFKAGSLRARFAGILLLTMVPVVWLLLYTHIQQRQQLFAELKQEASQVVVLAVREHDLRGESARQMLRVLSNSPQLLAGPATCSAYLGSLMQEEQVYAEFGVASPTGQVRCSASATAAQPDTQTPAAPIWVDDRGWFQAAIKTRRLAVGDYEINPSSGTRRLVYARPVLAADGAIAAVVYTAIDTGALQSIAASNRLAMGSTIAMFDRNNLLIAFYPDPDRAGTPWPLAAQLRLETSEHGPYTVIAPGEDGVTRAYAVLPLETATRRAYLAIGLPVDTAVRAMGENLWSDLFSLGLLTLLSLAAVWVSLHVLLLRQVTSLVQVSRRVGSGDLAARSALTSGAAELQELSHAFDQMAGSLERREIEHRYTEAQLRENEANLRLAQRVGRVGSWHNDFERGTIEWSEELYRILGLSSDTFTPTLQDSPYFAHPADRLRLLEAREQVLREGGEFQIDYRVTLPDGRERLLSSRGQLQSNEEGKPTGLLGTVQDITERIASDRALTDSERKFRTLFDLAHDAVLLVRCGAGNGAAAGTSEPGAAPANASALPNEPGPDRIVDCNARALAVFGYPRDQLLGHSHELLLPQTQPDGSESAATLLCHRALALDGQAQDFEWVFRRSDGTLFDAEVSLSRMELNGELLLQAIVRDITERKRAQTALIESEQRERVKAAELAAVLDAVPAAVWIAHDPHGSRITGNRASYELLDSAAAATGDQDSTELFPVDAKVFKDHVELAPYELPIQVAAGLGIEVRDFEQQLVFKDGRVRTVYGNATPLFDRDGKARGAVAAFMDITDLKRTEEALRREKRRVEVTLASIGDAVVTTDADGQVEYLNPVAETVLGVQSAQATGRPFRDLCHITHEIQRARPLDLVGECMARNALVELNDQHVLERIDGAELFIDASAAPLRDAEGAIAGVVLVLHDVTQQRKIAQQVSYQATHDALTGLINRFEFERRLTRILNSVQDDRSTHALAYLDLDQFKVVNDTCGHAAGDQLLRQLATRLHERMRKRDTIARLGGDEFGLLLEDCPPEQAARIANAIVQSVRDYRFTWEGKTFAIGVSIGLVSIDQTSGSSASVLSAADAACYAAKERGRNRVHVYHPNDAEVARRHGEMQWVSRLNLAIEQSRFRLDFQPIMPLQGNAEGGPEHIEMLVRLVDEEGKLIPPGAFIPAAERYNIMPQIDRWVIRRTLEWLAGEMDEADGPLPVCSINLSGTSLSDETLLAYIRDQVRSTGVPTGALCFEITETSAIANLAQATHFISELNAQGYTFALDDFGSGMSSFAYLKNLKVDYLKIDGSFVKDMVDDPIDCAMVEAINRIGQVMGIKTIAEYAENDRIIDKLRAIGVDYAQGFGVQAPQPLVSRQHARLRTAGVGLSPAAHGSPASASARNTPALAKVSAYSSPGSESATMPPPAQ